MPEPAAVAVGDPGQANAVTIAPGITVVAAHEEAPRGAPATSASLHPSPRAAMLAHLSADMAGAIAAGDLEAATLAHAMIGKLLEAALPGDGAAEVDFATAREKPMR